MAETLNSPDVIGAASTGNNPIANFQARFAQLPQKNRIAILAGVPLLIALLVSLMMWANQTSYKVLFSGLNDQDGGAITEALSQLKVPYQFNSSGTAILVPADKVYDTRLALASKGLPKGTVTGFEAMDNQKLGITQFQEQVNYQRALEGELARSIQSISAVENARVHLAIPKPSIFIREKQSPSASIVLTLYGGRTLSESQISGIVHLVSSSLPNMSPKDVSIVDQTGRLLTENDQSSTTGLNPHQLAYQNLVESNLTSRIINILTPVFGANNVRATVTADMDFSTQERTDEIYKPNSDPTQSTIRSQQLSESKDGTATNPSGVPGTLSNQPPTPATSQIGQNPQQGLPNQGNNTNSSAQNSSSRKDSTINYEVDKSVQYKKEQVGKIDRLSAAVVVNYKTVTDKKGESRDVPLTPDEVTQINTLVKQAIGFDEKRGDAVNVVNQAFTKETVETTPLWAQPDTMDLAKSLGLPIGVALVAAILVFGLFRPMMKPPVLEPYTEGPELLPGQNTALTVGDRGSDMELLEQLQREGALPNNGMSRQEKLDKLRNLAKEHPQIVANIVKNWVNGEAQNA
ncbi:flagellar M-ring protein FliF [Limnobacter humi]|uniref:Flagellar M-ring protein n=1 Tax=Limnobacter humi TaxID=1778671 RepID=A0ABT1WJR9_9BURK|nr:flagellar basal-body MS-ring/collar protein FliF [Limnobacter humi]MCQ8897755.1 flagellar M-ring protein FliF [Limnobacter humi]